ncbi:ParB/RepB/Spo0J family partition protein [Ornithinicoccus halotolerans]|uniref:ParB/RepB/Spo0J family partition protein n=1 Tax=Ornithinicoccus halotolerans TaxID=1748220 RepID=UPI001297B84B|nr:ParB/RepB/Spo0J family partition protein [Ornithinicoccus halotolerans]
MSERRRGLGRGLGALIPPAPAGNDRPSDVFFPRQTGSALAEEGAEPATGSSPSADDGHAGHAGEVTPSRFTGNGGQYPSDGVRTVVEDVGSAPELAPVPGARFAEVPVDQVQPNPRQPRQVFDEDELAELAHSIGEIGVLQPIVVRPVTDAGVGYELVMGERRWRASQRAGLETVPAIIREVEEGDLLRDALLENLHRSQLNPLEEAAAYRQLLDDFGCTQEELSRRIGRSRPQISNTLRLLRLPPLVQRRVASGVLSAGHARALLAVEDAAAMERLAQRIVAEGLSVRTVEEIVVLGQDDDGAGQPRRPRRKAAPDPELDSLADRLADRLDTRVSIAMGSRKGRLTVEFASREDLDRILSVLDAEH